MPRRALKSIPLKSEAIGRSAIASAKGCGAFDNSHGRTPDSLSLVNH